MLKAKLFRYTLPLRTPVYWGGLKYDMRDGALVRLRDPQGREGWGEIAPLPGFSPETLDSALNEARLALAKWGAIDDIHAFPLEPLSLASVRSGLEQALWQLNSAESWRAGCSVRLQMLLSGPHDQIIRDAKSIAKSGVEAIKFKVGQESVEKEIQLARRISRILPDARIRVDANQSWQLEQAQDFIGGVQDLQIDYIEEPVLNRMHLWQLMQESVIPIALDETLRGSSDDELQDAAPVHVIKPALMGGLLTTHRFIRQSLGKGKRCIVSSSWECGIGMHALLQLAAELPQEVHGLDTYRYLSNDVLVNRLQLNPPAFSLPANLPSTNELDWRYVAPA